MLIQRNGITALILLFLPLIGSAQETMDEEEQEELVQLKEELKGSYQIQMIGTRGRPAVPLSLFRTIHEKREAQEEVYHWVDETMRVRILPENKIESPEFEGVDERVVYLTEKEADK